MSDRAGLESGKKRGSKKKELLKIKELDSVVVARILPDHLYKPVAEIVGLDVDIKEKMALEKRKDMKKLFKGVRFLSKALQQQTIEDEEEESYTGDTYVEPSSPRATTPYSNPYFDLLQKPVREQVRWESKYLPPETEKEKGLVKRADEITNQICADFSKYVTDLGGYDSPLFKQENIKKLFQIEFNTHAAKSLCINPTEMKALPRELAMYVHKPQISYENTITNNILWDMKADKTPSKTLAFNRAITKQKHFKNPNNKTKEIWKPEDYPKETVTMETIWKDMESCKSVQDFCKWMVNHPEASRPKYLRKNQMFDVNNLKKICHQHKYRDENNLPPIDIKKLIDREEDVISPLPEDLKVRPDTKFSSSDSLNEILP